MLPRWVFGLVLLILATRALGDGKAFPMVADPLADAASSTMPRQRAIIAWDGAQQRLAIDTAFTGEGTEFAWLVPLPSEPEILPATKGMFDTAAVLTAPRLRDGDSGWLIFFGGLLVFAALVTMALRTAMPRVVFLMLFSIFIIAVFVSMPMVGKARGSAGPPTAVEVVSTGTAGLYETVVLRATRADELIAWLHAGGYAAPGEAAGVMQTYLDKGWVFAAAKLAVQDASAAEHRAHPLRFDFKTDAPVYPMALTSVGNGDIELELFVLADGRARAKGLRAASCHRAVPDTRDPDDHYAMHLLSQRPVTIAHPGLIDMAAGRTCITRLVGELTPAEQREDIVLAIEPFEPYDPTYNLPGTGVARGVGDGLIVAGVAGVLMALFAVSGRQDRVAISREQGRAAGVMAFAGVLVGTAVALATREYKGPLASGRASYGAESTLSSIATYLPEFAAEQQAMDLAGVRALLEGFAPKETFEALGVGDSPLHYRFEPSDGGHDLWFIWHDAIGDEHRVLVPLVDVDGLVPGAG